MVRHAGAEVGGKGFVRLEEDSATAVFVVDRVETQEALIEAPGSVPTWARFDHRSSRNAR